MRDQRTTALGERANAADVLRVRTNVVVIVASALR